MTLPAEKDEIFDLLNSFYYATETPPRRPEAVALFAICLALDDRKASEVYTALTRCGKEWQLHPIELDDIFRRLPNYGVEDINHCWYCGCRIHADYDSGWNMRVQDHVIPRSKGGKRPGNLVYACSLCNARKHAKTVEEFRDHCYRRTPHGRSRDLAEQILATWPAMPPEIRANVTGLISFIDDLAPRGAYRFYGETTG